MITAYERSDIMHIMKINRFELIDSDTAQLHFNGRFKEKDYAVTILVIDNLPSVTIKQSGETVSSETVKSIDDLKIFLEERLYKYLEA
jgi:hypothetical protein